MSILFHRSESNTFGSQNSNRAASKQGYSAPNLLYWETENWEEKKKKINSP